MSQTSLTPAPDFAVKVWKEGESLVVQMPEGVEVRVPLQPFEWLASPRKCNNSSHPLSSCPAGGLRQFALLLKARGELTSSGKIAELTTPTQWNIDTKTISATFLAEERLKKALEKKALKDKTLADIEKKRTRVQTLSNEDFLKELGLI